jgi:mono/diheme cytochrome c family protein
MRKILAAAALLPLVALGARALAADAPAAAPPPGAGLDLINERCVFCHNNAQIFSQRKTAPAWAATVEQMANRGAEVSPEEMKVIVDYLSKNYGGPDQSAAPAAPQN